MRRLRRPCRICNTLFVPNGKFCRLCPKCKEISKKGSNIKIILISQSRRKMPTMMGEEDES